jgi:hypothetical protein
MLLFAITAVTSLIAASKAEDVALAFHAAATIVAVFGVLTTTSIGQQPACAGDRAASPTIR